jgi:protein gp37
MGTKTAIEWTDATWSPIRARVKEDAAKIAREKRYESLVQIAEKMAGRVGPHCEHVSPGCGNCYAEANNARCLPANGTGLPYDRRARDLVEPFLDESHLRLPLKWRGMERIFVENQSDLFGEWVTDEMLDRVFAVMALCPQYAFQVLTKRPERMLRYFSEAIGRDGSLMTSRRTGSHICTEREMQIREAAGHYLSFVDQREVVLRFPLPNLWLGVSVENQAAADERIPLLLQTPAAVRFISAEPLLEPVLLDRIGEEPEGYLDALRGFVSCDGRGTKGIATLDWVICGGESGPGARPMHPDWARSLRDQCAAASVPFFFKQWGEWLAAMQDGARDSGILNASDGPLRVGKHKAGALLDGAEYRQFPEAR